MGPHATLLSLVVLWVLFGGVHVFGYENTLTQVSTLDALLSGIYEGPTTVDSLKRHGNFGLGTFNDLDGEMVTLDGRFYQVAADGTVRIAPGDVKSPFAVLTSFREDQVFNLEADTDYRALKRQADSVIPTENIFYAVKVEGRFRTVKARSVPRQNRPYKTLTEIVAAQPLFHFEDVEGIMVGFRSPRYASALNVTGYHLHFLTKDRKAGGHVLDFAVQKAKVRIDHLHRFLLILPDDASFYRADLTQDRSLDREKVEKSTK